jgi:hypothetical protein
MALLAAVLVHFVGVIVWRSFLLPDYMKRYREILWRRFILLLCKYMVQPYKVVFKTLGFLIFTTCQHGHEKT